VTTTTTAPNLPENLPRTGSASMWMILGAGILILVGGGFSLYSKFARNN
jgi:LPXTG-motif cell wall-anchored protein